MENHSLDRALSGYFRKFCTSAGLSSQFPERHLPNSRNQLHSVCTSNLYSVVFTSIATRFVQNKKLIKENTVNSSQCFLMHPCLNACLVTALHYLKFGNLYIEKQNLYFLKTWLNEQMLRCTY